MKKILCKIFGHKWRWVISEQQVLCVRCRKQSNVAQYHMDTFGEKTLKSF